MTDETTTEVYQTGTPAEGDGVSTFVDTDDDAGEPLGSPEPGPVPNGTPDDEPETFSREYVEKLRQENGKYRQRAGESDSLANRLHTELVRATGRLADPTDLPFDAEHLADADKMIGAINGLLTRKPHLAARKPAGDIGQGATPSGATVDLAAILRGKAG